MNNNIKVFISSILAGFIIGISVAVYLTCCAMDHKIVGSLLFALGLFSIVHFKLHLYTGKVGNLLHEKPSYILTLLICLLGNIIGAAFLALIVMLTRSYDVIYEYANKLAYSKENDTWYSIFILANLCGVMIYTSYKGHEKCEYSIGKLAFIFIGISIFILCGFEHCVANVAYFIFGKVLSLKVLLYFLIMVLGNATGAIIFDFALNSLNKKK